MYYEIKKCPFCGSSASIQDCSYFGSTPMWSVMCDNPKCFAYTEAFKTKQGAIETWNKRPIEDELCKKIEELERRCSEKITGETSDGYHTFNELYYHRAVLFSAICRCFPERSWKSRKHHDGTMYPGMFIVGIETDDGQATYHYDIEPCWDMFPVKELEQAPEWDGHTPQQAIERIHNMRFESITNLIHQADLARTAALSYRDTIQQLQRAVDEGYRYWKTLLVIEHGKRKEQ